MSDLSAAANPAPGFAVHPEHEVKVLPYAGRVIVEVDGARIAETTHAMMVQETNHPPVYYVPIEDIDGDRLARSSHATRCPFKGIASYWNIVVGDHEIDNALWAYETPYDELLELAGLAAFYESKVTIHAEPA